MGYIENHSENLKQKRVAYVPSQPQPAQNVADLLENVIIFTRMYLMKMICTMKFVVSLADEVKRKNNLDG